MVHRFLRSIGFSNIKTRAALQNIIRQAVKEAYAKGYTTIDENVLYAEYFGSFGERIGLCVRGEYDDNNKFVVDYCFPYLKGHDITTYEDISIDRQTEKLSFAGVVDDYHIGVSLIFYLQSIITYMKYFNNNKLPLKGTSLTLTGLSDGGTILFPLSKDSRERQMSKMYHSRKSKMLRDAVDGNEDAIESLTMGDIGTQKLLQDKIKNEDIYSLVDTYFMPYGMECDLYAILGEIVNYQLIKNTLSGEEVYIISLDVNGILFDICVNKKDITGEVEKGRRYKGIIWLQGEINFPER